MKFAVPSFALIFSFCFCGVKTPRFSKDHAKRSKQLETNVYNNDPNILFFARILYARGQRMSKFNLVCLFSGLCSNISIADEK